MHRYKVLFENITYFVVHGIVLRTRSNTGQTTSDLSRYRFILKLVPVDSQDTAYRAFILVALGVVSSLTRARRRERHGRNASWQGGLFCVAVAMTSHARQTKSLEKYEKFGPHWCRIARDDHGDLIFAVYAVVLQEQKLDP